MSWLATKGFVAETARAARVLYEITDFGRECMGKGTYEQRIVDLACRGGPLALPEIARKLGIEQKDVGSAFGGLSKDRVLAMDAEKRARLAPGGRERLAPRQQAIQSLLKRAADGAAGRAGAERSGEGARRLAGEEARRGGKPLPSGGAGRVTSASRQAGSRRPPP